MKFLFLSLVVAFSGCATYAGKDRVAVYSNCSHMKWTGGEKPTLEMWNVNNSDPTRVGLDGITKVGTAVGTALLSHGASALIPHVK